LLMAEQAERRDFGMPHGLLDLGCSGGQLVSDFLSFGWYAAGLEGSDYSAKTGRANWPKLGGVNLFTCDITKPFQLEANGSPVQFDVITAWEVLEHIHENDLPKLLENICNHLKPGGLFIASTCSGSCVINGIELHQTRWSNGQWKEWFGKVGQLEPTDPGLSLMQHVRVIHEERSFLYYKKVS
jgi:2-polyprenyl-3-methyl-5-hydroxy-6-metoxy-1,4-benzoquinol methylase